MEVPLLYRNKTLKPLKFYIVLFIISFIFILQIINTLMLYKFNNFITDNNMTFYIRKVEKLIDLMCNDMKC